MNIGLRLRELRQARQFSQGDIEKRTGLLRCYISRVENGHTVPSIDTLEKCAKALDLELYQLFYSGAGKPKAVKVETPQFEGQEKKLVEHFRRMPEPDQKWFLGLARETTRHRGKLR